MAAELHNHTFSEDRMTSAQPMLGEIVSWDTNSPELPLTDIRNALQAAGLPDDVARDLNNRSAFSRATKHLKENRSIDKVKEAKDGKITFQLTRKEKAGERIDFNYETTVTLDTKTGDIICDDSVIEDQARKLFAHAMQVRTASDITRMVQSLFKNHADLFPINPSKGVAYFVPNKFADFTAKVEQFLRTVGGNVWRFPVPSGTSEGNRSVQEAVNSGLESILAELDECIENWDDTTRGDTIKRAIDKYKLIDYKARAYAEYLAGKSSDFAAKVDACRKKLLDRASEIRATADAA
jgi:hypothetical protein